MHVFFVLGNKNNILKRVLILSALFFIVLFSSGCSTVDKALYDVTNSVSSVDRVSGQRSLNLYSRANQIAKSNQQVDSLIAQNYTKKGLKVNGELDVEGYKRLQRIFKRVHAVSHMKDEDWRVFLIPEDSFNAFVTGGSYAIVHKGLLDEVQSDDELAYILGHEIAHVSANHVYESQTYNVSAMLAGSKSARRGSFQAAFTHENEEEADRVGLLYATLAGYNPEKAAESWTRMGEKHGYHASTYSTHPIAKERAAMNAKLAENYKPHYLSGKINAEHDAILDQYFATNTPAGEDDIQAKKPGEGAGLSALFQTVGSALSTRAKAKQEEARQSQRIAFIQYAASNLKLIDKKRIGNDRIDVTFQYSGNTSLSELLMKGLVGEEIAIAAYRNPIRSGDQVIMRFDYKETTVTDSGVTKMKIGIDYAEAL